MIVHLMPVSIKIGMNLLLLLLLLCVFMLQQIIQKRRGFNLTTYTMFVDFEKAFDKV